MIAETRTGPQLLTDGTGPNAARSDRTGALVVSDAHGHWSEAAVRRSLYTAYLKAGTTTVAAGNIEAAAAAASTQFAVWNPTTSTVNLVLQKLVVSIQSGTPTAGGLSHSKFNAAAVSISTTAGAISANYFGAAAGQGLCLASAAGSALTGGGSLTTVGYSPLSGTATAAGNAAIVFQDTIDGALVVPPGMGYVPTWTGAGTTFVVGYSLTWEEVTA